MGLIVGTNFQSKCEILADIFLEHRDDEKFADFVEYADVGLPLAFILHRGYATASENSGEFIDDSFAVLLGILEVEDQNYESLGQLLRVAEGGAHRKLSGKFCTECGTALLEVGKFCTECGTTVAR